MAQSRKSKAAKQATGKNGRYAADFIEKMRARMAAGESVVKLAAQTGVSNVTLYGWKVKGAKLAAKRAHATKTHGHAAANGELEEAWTPPDIGARVRSAIALLRQGHKWARSQLQTGVLADYDYYHKRATLALDELEGK